MTHLTENNHLAVATDLEEALPGGKVTTRRG